MWFNILPAYLIITASVGLPGYGLYWLHYLFNGNHHRRSLLDRWERSQYQRDMRITGNPYVSQGLEAIPDWEEHEKLAKAPKPIIKQNL